jgi:hypothetical protein
VNRGDGRVIGAQTPTGAARRAVARHSRVDETRTARLVGYSDQDAVQSLGFSETPDGDGWVLIIQRGENGERCLSDQDGRTTYARFSATHRGEKVTFSLSMEAAEELGCSERVTVVLDCPPEQGDLVSAHLSRLTAGPST